MNQTRMRRLRRAAYVVLATSLLALALLLAACGGAGTSTNQGNSNISTNGQSTTQSTPVSIQEVNQQVQNGVQAIDNAQNDVNSADATATVESGSQQQP